MDPNAGLPNNLAEILNIKIHPILFGKENKNGSIFSVPIIINETSEFISLEYSEEMAANCGIFKEIK